MEAFKYVNSYRCTFDSLRLASWMASSWVTTQYIIVLCIVIVIQIRYGETSATSTFLLFVTFNCFVDVTKHQNRPLLYCLKKTQIITIM